MPNPEEEGYIWISDAAKKYGKSRTWLEYQKLTHKTYVGNRRVYLKVSEIEDLLSGATEVVTQRPRPERPSRPKKSS